MNIANIGTNVYIQKTENEITKSKLPTGAAAKNTVDAFEKAINGIAVSIGDDKSKAMNGIKESISSIEEDIKSDAQMAKNNLKALFNKLSGAEAVKLDEDGFDLNEMDDEELVGVVERIKIMLAAYNSNFQQFSGAFDMADSDSIDDSNVNLSTKVARKLEQNNIPSTDDNISEVSRAIEMSKDVAENMPLSDSAKEYLIDNELEPSIKNVYRANHSTGSSNAAQVNSFGNDDNEWQEIKPQVKKILNQANIEESDKNYDNAKWLMSRNLPVTSENIIMKNRLDELSYVHDENKVINKSIDEMLGGNKATSIITDGEKVAWKQAADAINVINNVTFSDVETIVNEDRKFTIAEMVDQISSRVDDSNNKATGMVGEGIINSGNYQINSENSSKVVESYRLLLEARVMMTATSTVSIINQGIDIYSEDLRNLVDMLHANEANFISEELNSKKYDKVTSEDISNVLNVSDLMSSLKFTPAAAIGNMIAARTTLTVTSVTQIAFTMQRQYEAAGTAYETMGTKARSDMGDSVKAAVDNSANSILDDLSLENNDINKRAVRILAYNNMEMTQENIENVRNVDSMLNNLMDNITPQVALSMIRDGINPLNTDIKTLNDYINENYASSEPAVKYSEFLYKLEKSGDISSEERKEYIGIYKMFHQLKKDGGKAVGALLAQGAEINLGNLVTFMESRKKYGMDVTLESDAGLAEVTGSVSYFQNLFSKLSKNITPLNLKKASGELGNLNNLSMEKLSEIMDENSEEDQRLKEEFFENQILDAKECQNIEDSVLRMITDQGMPVTFYNMMSADRLLGNGRRYGGKVFEDLQNLKDSKIETSVSNLLNALDSKETIDEAMKELSESVKANSEEVMQSDSENSYDDINSLKMMTMTTRFMSELTKRNQYFIPLAGDSEISGINLKLVKTGEESGKLEMRFETIELGNVYAQFSVSRSVAAGYFVSDSKDGVDKLSSYVDNIKEKIASLGIESVDINVSQGKDIPQVTLFDNGEETPTNLIYKVAKEILLAV